MRDFLPAEKAQRERVLGVIRDTYRAHGFDEIETPVMEDTARLTSGLGGDNEKLAYAIMKRGLTAGDLAAAAASGDTQSLTDLGLRFDLTVPLARFYATHRAALPGVFRAIQMAPVWRAERPQKGRYRQFVQCDIDIIGDAGPLAETELITATADTLTRLGLTGWSVRINDRRILTTMLGHWGVPAEQHDRALITIDKLDKIGADGVAAELAGHGITADGLADTLTTTGWNLLEGTDPTGAPAWLNTDAYGDLLALRDALPHIDLVFDPTLVRGMGYYTGTIFEIAHPASSSSLGGGGRYDGMIGRFLGTDVPACGFSLGFERLVDLVTLTDDEQADAVALVHDTDVPHPTLLALKAHLVASGKRVRLEQRTKNTKALLERLALDGFTHFAFVDDDTTADSLELRELDEPSA